MRMHPGHARSSKQHNAGDKQRGRGWGETVEVNKLYFGLQRWWAWGSRA